MLRAIVYLRVSTSQQAEEGTSLPEQLRQCQDKAAREGAVIVRICSDEGVSGALFLARPGIQSAITDIETGKADCIITMNLTRAGRNVVVLKQIEKRISQAGGTLLFCDGTKFDDTPTGRLMMTQFAGFAEYERDIIRERTMAGARRRVQSGKAMSCGSRAFGYIIVTKAHITRGEFPPEQEGKYHLHPDESPTAAQIFERIRTGSSLRDVVLWLAEKGVPTVSGGKWWTATISDILKNPLYKGQPSYGRTANMSDESRISEGKSPRYAVNTPRTQVYVLEAPAVVSPEVWDECQERMKTNKKCGNLRTRSFLLSGILRCPQCGGAMSGISEKRKTSVRRTYRCHNAVNSYHEDTHCTGAKRVDVEPMEADVSEQVLTMLRECYNANAEKARQAAIRCIHFSNELPVSAIDQKLRQLDNKKAAAIRCQIKAEVAGQDTTPYDKIIMEIQSEKESLTQRLNRLPKPVLQLPEQGADYLVRIIHDPSVSIEQRGVVLRAFIRSIKFNGEKWCIEPKFPPREKQTTPVALEDDPEYLAWLNLYRCLIAIMNKSTL